MGVRAPMFNGASALGHLPTMLALAGTEIDCMTCWVGLPQFRAPSMFQAIGGDHPRGLAVPQSATTSPEAG